MGRAGLRNDERSDRPKAAIDLSHPAICFTESGRMDMERGQGNGAGQGWRASKAAKIRADFHADPFGILAKGLGKGLVIGYGCDVVIGQQAC